MKIWTFYLGAKSNTVCVECSQYIGFMDFMVTTSYSENLIYVL